MRGIPIMKKAALIERLEKLYAAEDYFTGALGNPHAVVLGKPKPQTGARRLKQPKDSFKTTKALNVSKRK
jgi:hypothetical protein